MNEFEHEERLSRQRAAEHLADIAYALTAGGTLEVRTQGRRVSFPLADTVLLMRGGSTDGDRVDVEVRLRWSAPATGGGRGTPGIVAGPR